MKKNKYQKLLIDERDRLGAGHKLAAASGICPSTIQDICSGKIPSKRTIDKIEAYFNRKKEV